MDELLKSFIETLKDQWPVVTEHPALMAVVLGLGLILGWAAAFLVLKQRLTFHKEMIEQYEKAASNKATPKPKSKVLPSKPVFPFKLLFAGVFILLLIVILPPYILIISLRPPNYSYSRMAFGFSNFFHDQNDHDMVYSLNVQFQNRGNIDALRTSIAISGIVKESQMDAETIKSIIENLKSQEKQISKENTGFPDIGPNEGRVVTVPGVKLTEEQVRNLGSGKDLIYVFYSISWEDDVLGSRQYWHQDFCGFYQGVLSYVYNCAPSTITKITGPRF